eukprot:5645605-Amphidinium_carterae.1
MQLCELLLQKGGCRLLRRVLANVSAIWTTCAQHVQLVAWADLDMLHPCQPAHLVRTCHSTT